MRLLLRLGMAAHLAFFANCAHAPSIVDEPLSRHTLAVAVPGIDESPQADAVVVVTIDGARWQEIFNGTDEALRASAQVAAKTAAERMPTLARWMHTEGSAVGAPGHGAMRATGPNYISLPGYTEILSGRSPTACQSNDCPATREATLLDQIATTFPSDSVAVISSWEPIAGAATVGASDRMVTSAGRVVSRGLPEGWLATGKRAAPWPGDGTYRPDAFTRDVALHVLTATQPRAMFVGLGDTDEFAHHGDYAGYLSALESADAFLHDLEVALSSMGSRGAKTAVFVTCDHGRSANFRDHGGEWPEAGRVWLVAHGAGIAPRGVVDVTRATRLADVAPTVRALLGLEHDNDPQAGTVIDEILSTRLY